jgi:hypothetical protein
MATTESEQSNIVKLVVGMFNAAPGSAVLAEIVNVFEANGHNYAGLASTLATTGAFASIYSPALSSGEFAAAFLGTLGLGGNAAANEFVAFRAESGENRGLIILDALVALWSTSAPEFAQAKALLNDKTQAAVHDSITEASVAMAIAPLSDTAFDAATMGGSNFTGVAVSGDLGVGAIVNGTGFFHGLTVTGDPGGWDLTLGFAGTGGGADALNIVFNDEIKGGDHTLDFATLRIDGIETFNVASGGSDQGDINQIDTFSSDTVSVINVTGANEFDLFGLANVTAAGVTSFAKLDASTATAGNRFLIGDLVGQQTAAVKASVAYTVVLGLGDDFVAVASDAGNAETTTATIDVSSGGDDLIGLESFFASGASVASGSVGSVVNIVGANVGEMIAIANVANVAMLGAAQSVGSATNIAQAANMAVAAAGANDIAWFTLGGNTYIAVDAGSDNAYTNADQLIKLVGMHDLSTSSYADGAITLAP